MKIYQKSVDIFLAKSTLNKIDRLYKKTHTAIFTGQTECGKTYLVLELIENYYNKHFDYIIIICPALRENSTYHAKEWIKSDDKVWLTEPKDNLYQWIQKLLELLRFLKVLFIIDDIIANKDIHKRRQNYPSRGDIEVIIYGC